MKKSLFILTAALSFGFAAAQTADPVAPATPTAAPAAAPQVPALTDVPAGHWAKDAIDRLVSRGIILGYPDGTYRGTQNLTRYEAAVIIARLLDQIRTGDVSTTNITAEDLTALQNAIQELAADLTALGVRVSDLEENAVNRDDFSRLEARVEELAAANGDAAAITAIQAQIAELTARADEYDTLRADIDDNASSIAALNDLTVLLNQDILNLQDRVSAVESAQADFVQRSDFDNLAGRVGTIDTRVTTLENAPRFSVVGSLAPRFGRLALVQNGAGDFDVDRLTNGTFGAGVFSSLANGADVTVVDTTQNFNNAATGIGLTFGVRATNLVSTGSLAVRNAAINFGSAAVTDTGGTVRRAITLSDASVDGTFAGGPFSVRYTQASNAFKFSDYLFSNSDGLAGPGFVATFSPAHPLNPTVTVVGGNSTSGAITGGAAVANYFGVRTVVKPNANSTVGVSYAQAEGKGVGFSTDYNVQLGIVNVKGEGAISIPNAPQNFVFGGGTLQNAFTNGNKAFYTEARANLGIAQFGVNYRTIDPDFNIDGTNAGMSVNNTMPYDYNQTGFGAAVGTALGPIAFGAYGDTYTQQVTTTLGQGTTVTTDDTTVTNAGRTTAFGVKAGAKLGALELVGFFNRTTADTFAEDGTGTAVVTTSNAVVDSADDKRNNDYADVGMGIAGVPFAYTSTVGARLRHDGKATNALVPNLNFTVQDAYYYNSRTNNFAAYADYSATLAGITVAPLLRYNLVTNPDADVVGESNTIKYGIKLSTAPLAAIPLQPSVYANFVNRITNAGTSSGVSNGTTTELLGQVGVSLNQFLAPGATAKVGYSYYQGFNVASPKVSVGEDDVAFNAADNRVYSSVGDQSGLVNGVYGQVGFNGLTANYGVFRYTNLTAAPVSSVAQGFRVNYTFRF
jgi:hypothetical protein